MHDADVQDEQRDTDRPGDDNTPHTVAPLPDHGSDHSAHRRAVGRLALGGAPHPLDRHRADRPRGLDAPPPAHGDASVTDDRGVRSASVERTPPTPATGEGEGPAELSAR